MRGVTRTNTVDLKGYTDEADSLVSDAYFLYFTSFTPEDHDTLQCDGHVSTSLEFRRRQMPDGITQMDEFEAILHGSGKGKTQFGIQIEQENTDKNKLDFRIVVGDVDITIPVDINPDTDQDQRISNLTHFYHQIPEGYSNVAEFVGLVTEAAEKWRKLQPNIVCHEVRKPGYDSGKIGLSLPTNDAIHMLDQALQHIGVNLKNGGYPNGIASVIRSFIDLELDFAGISNTIPDGEIVTQKIRAQMELVAAMVDSTTGYTNIRPKSLPMLRGWYSSAKKLLSNHPTNKLPQLPS